MNDCWEFTVKHWRPIEPADTYGDEWQMLLGTCPIFPVIANAALCWWFTPKNEGSSASL